VRPRAETSEVSNLSNKLAYGDRLVAEGLLLRPLRRLRPLGRSHSGFALRSAETTETAAASMGVWNDDGAVEPTRNSMCRVT